MAHFLGRFRTTKKGATSIEYALIASFMVIAIIGGTQVFTEEVESIYNYVSTYVTDAADSLGT